MIYRAKLEESLPDGEEQSKIKDRTTIELIKPALNKAPANARCETVTLEGEQQDLSQLAPIRRVHQTSRAAKSTKSHKASTPSASSASSQRHHICSQMAEVIHRSSTGLEREIRWKSGSAPGTKDSTEVSQLSGNSENAEIAAKEHVSTVHGPLSLCNPTPDSY